MDFTIRFRLALVGLMIGVVSARAELRLQPQPSTFQLEGITFPQVIFHDNDKVVAYVPPRGWKYSGSETILRLWPNGVTQAEASVTKLPLSKTASFDEANRHVFVEEAIAALPQGSTNAQVVSQELNPVRIGGNDTFLVTISFTSYGNDFSRSVMFLNREQDQIQFQLTSRTSDFPALQKAFLKSHFSWRGL